jgi:hypothetical protein
VTGIVKELLSSGVKAETLAEEMLNTIIDEPKPELVSLLSKLVEVKSPYAEARLLVALMPQPNAGVLANTSVSGPRPSGPFAFGNSRPEGRAPRADGAKSRAAALRNAPSPEVLATPATTNEEIKPAKEDNPSPAQTQTSSISSFSWDEFVEKVKELNDAVYMQLVKTEHEFIDNELNIYPKKNITKTILSRDSNKHILSDAAPGVKITIHDTGETPKNQPKNETLSKISDIMGGGEVIHDGGENPF